MQAEETQPQAGEAEPVPVNGTEPAFNLTLPDEPKKCEFEATHGITMRYLCRPLAPQIEIEAQAAAGLGSARLRALSAYATAKAERLDAVAAAAKKSSEGEPVAVPDPYPEDLSIEADCSRYILEIARLVVVEFLAVEKDGNPLMVNGKAGTDPTLRQLIVEQIKGFASHAHSCSVEVRSHVEEVQGN